VSLGNVLGQIFQLSTRFSIEVQPQFNLLQKTMMMAEGVARQLNPEADMWTLARPLAASWMKDRASLGRQVEVVVQQALAIATRLPRILDALEAGKTQPEPAPRMLLPTALSCLALALALLSFFT